MRANTSANVLVGAVDGLTRQGVEMDAFGAELCALVGRRIPFDFACFATLDPATTMITKAVKTADLGIGDEEFAHYEYAVDDVNQFSEISLRRTPTGILGQDTSGHPEVSARYREYLMPRFSFAHELRATFRSRGRSWGALSLHRTTGSRDFTPHEAALLSTAGEAVALGIRRSLFVAGRQQEAIDLAGPAVIVVDAANRIVQRTPAVEAVLREIADSHDGYLPASLMTVVAAARAATRGAATARVRTRSGSWVVLQAVPLISDVLERSDIVVTVEPASPRQLSPLALEAFGLTNREQQVAQLVLQGLDTQAITKNLHLSPHTVQDHLKSIFAKAEVSSRRELIARAFFDQHAPHIGGSLQTDGSLTRRG